MADATSSFCARASAAAARASTLTPPELLAQELANDRPTIDSAIKSYMSLVAARSLTQTKAANAKVIGGSEEDAGKCHLSGDDPRDDALQCARALLKCINSLTIPHADEEAEGPATERSERKEDEESKLEGDVVRIVWNGLIKSEKKPSKFLGRRSLARAYPYVLRRLREEDDEGILPVRVERTCAMSFFEEFGALLQRGKREDDDEDDDSALLWDKDGGAAELARRRERRARRGEVARAHAAAATEAALSPNAGNTVTIEEITEEE